jgi:hypothetical protein
VYACSTLNYPRKGFKIQATVAEFLELNLLLDIIWSELGVRILHQIQMNPSDRRNESYVLF